MVIGYLLLVIGETKQTSGRFLGLGNERRGNIVRMRAELEEMHMPDSIRTFEDLECWKAGREIRLFVARHVMPLLPKEERFRLGDQLIRAARSVTTNIAEGYGRFHYLDNSKFCSIARGSCCEVLDHLITASDEGFLAAELLIEGRAKIVTALKLLNGYMAYLKRASATNNQ